MNIDEALEQLARDNDLSTVSVAFSRYMVNDEEHSSFRATVHWSGFSRSDLSCTSAMGKTVKEALTTAIRESAVLRTPTPTLPEPGVPLTLESLS